MTEKELRRAVIRKLELGQTLKIKTNGGVEKVTVSAFYPSFVLCHGAGLRKCYSYYEMWTCLQHKGAKV